MKLALVLSGGAARGAFHLGALACFDDENIKFDAFSGSSIGALIASSYLSGVKPREQLEIYKSNEFRKNIKINPYLNSFFKFNLKSEIANRLIKFDKIEELNKPLFICTFNFLNKQINYLNEGDSFKLCEASCALPILFPSVKIGSRKHIDGGLVDNLPIKPLLNQDYKIVSIDLLPRQKKKNLKKTFNLIKIVKRKIFKTWHKNMDFSIANSDIYITSLELRKFSMFSFKDLDELFDLGYKEASKYISSIKQ